MVSIEFRFRHIAKTNWFGIVPSPLISSISGRLIASLMSNMTIQENKNFRDVILSKIVAKYKIRAIKNYKISVVSLWRKLLQNTKASIQPKIKCN
jgi:hypothetical protein